MSRALRKLRTIAGVETGIPGGPSNADGSDGDDGDGIQVASRTKKLNRFDMFVEDQPSNDNDDEQQLDGSSDDDAEPTTTVSRPRRRKKRHINGTVEPPLEPEEGGRDLDEIEASLAEVNRILGPPGPSDVEQEAFTISTASAQFKKDVLQIENRHLNPITELRRIEESSADKKKKKLVSSRQRRRHEVSRTWYVSHPQWNNVPKPAIKMDIDERTEEEIHFSFAHTKSYQQMEFTFLDALDSADSDNLAAVLNTHPNLINCLLQIASLVGQHDPQMASELIERSLYCFETCFHHSFNLAQRNCRISYKRPENRAFYITLFKHAEFLGWRQCYRTALEFLKVILSLDPETDPLSTISSIDNFALRSKEYDYLISLYRQWQYSKGLFLYPNFRFSVPLALFLKSRGKDEALLKEANEMIQDALLSFPSILLPLLDKCNVEPDAEVQRSPYFSSQDCPSSLDLLIRFYVARNYEIWLESDALLWLESNVRACLATLKDNPEIQFHEKHKSFFGSSTPRNILRHVYLSNVRISLPSKINEEEICAYDPFPPADSIVSYERPEVQSEASAGGLVGVFLRSLFPGFNVDEDATRARARQVAIGQGEPARAIENQQPAQGNLRDGVNSLMGAMRHMLNSFSIGDEDGDESD